jgi:hypothetical protein
MRLEVTERLCNLGGPREESSEHFLWHLFEREFMTLSIQRVDDFVEAHKISDECQILTIACPIRVFECSGNDVAEFGDVAHVNDPRGWIKRKSPAQGSVCLLLRSQGAYQVSVVEGRDDECVIRKPGFFHYGIDFGFSGKVGNVELAATDRFYIGQRRPDEMFDAGIPGGAYRRGCLL